VKAVIFNSGSGKRMGDFTKTHHKSMACLPNGETIFARQLRLLSENGIHDFVVTTGPFREQLEEVAASSHLSHLNVIFVQNPQFESTNYIYSMFLAKEYFDDDVLLLHGDLVFNNKIIEKMLSDSRPNLVAVDREAPLPEKDFKARLVDNTIRQISVSLFDDSCFALQPLYKLSRQALSVWSQKVGDFISAGFNQVYAEDALNVVSREICIKAFSYTRDFVSEVDTIEDLKEVASRIRLVDFSEQPVINETDGYLRIPEILEANQIRHPLLVCGRSFDELFLKPFFDELEIDYVRFSNFSPNPSYQEIKSGVDLFLQEDCDALISVGGGSAIDVAKCIKLFAPLNQNESYIQQEHGYASFKHIAIPTTAGTGSESTHFSVMYIDGEKTSVAQDCMLPDYAILEPRVLATLSEYQKKVTLLDALSQCIESLWSIKATEESRAYAKKGAELIITNFFSYKKGSSREIERKIMIAANLSGKAINLTQTTAAHAMSYKLAQLYGLAHGHAVALCLPHVWRYMLGNIDKYLDVRALAQLRQGLETLKQVFSTKNDQETVEQFELIVDLLEIESPQLRDFSEIRTLADSVNQQRLSNNPIPLDRDAIVAIYKSLFGFVSNDNIDNIKSINISNLNDDDLTKEDIRNLQTYELEILVAFVAFCKKHKLKYYLSEGTMLGAVRHGGFIPWDEDVDVMMPRKDYKKFVDLCLDGKLTHGYNLDSFETNPKHWVLGAKMQIKRKTEFAQKKTHGLAQYVGPYIDIFPLDAVDSKNTKKLRRQWRTVRVLRRLLFMSTGFSTAIKRKPHRVVLRFISLLIPPRQIHKILEQVMEGDKKKQGCKSYINFCTYYSMKKEVYPIEWYGEGHSVSFEGYKFIVPSNAKKMLKKIYGSSYMDIPNNKLRRQRNHSFTVNHEFVKKPKRHQKNPEAGAANLNETPLISVIVPVYNVEGYLRRCLDSLVNQEFDDFEIIVVNDGSTDGSGIILDEYESAYRNLLRSYEKNNGGVSSARNFGMKYAHGEFIVFVDGDDYVSIYLLRNLTQWLNRTNADIIEFAHYCCFETTGTYESCFLENTDLFNNGSVKETPELLVAIHPYIWGKLYRRSLFADNGIGFPEGQIFEDLAVVWNIAYMANRIESLNERLYYHMQDRDDSLRNSINQSFFDVLKSFDSVLGFYTKLDDYDKTQESIYIILLRVLHSRLIALKSSDNREFIFEFIDSVYCYFDENMPGWQSTDYYKSSMINLIGKKEDTEIKAPTKDDLKEFYTSRINNVNQKENSEVKCVLSEKERGRLQQELLKVLLVFDKFCKEHNLIYYLAEGSLLGAIRHGGFIPWDDGMDVTMPREDYGKLIKLFGDNTIDNCMLLNQDTYDGYYLTFVKIITRAETGFTNTSAAFPEEFSGPCVNVFPLDAGIAKDTKRRQQTIEKTRDILLLKANYPVKMTKKHRWYRLVSHFYSFSSLHNKIENLYRHYEGSPEAEYLVNYASSYKSPKETWPVEAYGNPRYVSFEGYLFPVPRNADEVLRKTYNNYFVLPPEKKRKFQHGFKYKPTIIESERDLD